MPRKIDVLWTVLFRNDWHKNKGIWIGIIRNAQELNLGIL